jgi:hypothetical protein
MGRAVLGACMLMLTAGCSAGGASTTPVGTGSNAQPVQAPVAAPGQPAQVPAQKAPGQPVAPASRATPAPAQPQPVMQPSGAPGDGTQPCPADAGPPVHKICPGA